MKVEIKTWLVHIYRDGVYAHTVVRAMERVMAERYAEVFNQVHGAGEQAVVHPVTFEAEAPDRMAA